MRMRISINRLNVGMFVEAGIDSLAIDGEVHHFLEARQAERAQSSSKRARLTERKKDKVVAAGGMLITAQRQIDALRETGLINVCIDTEKSDVVPDPDRADSPGAGRQTRGRVAAIPDASEPAVDAPPTAAANGPGDAVEGAALPPSSERRKNFGTSNKGWMKIDTDAEGQRAVLRVLSFGGDVALGRENVLKALDDLYGITSGIDEDVLEQLVTRARQSPDRVIRGHFPIAHGVRAKTPGRVDYSYLDGVSEAGNLPYEQLLEAFAQEELEEVLARNVPTRVVIPGEKLAVVTSNTEAEANKDIFGRSASSEGPEALLRAGAHVKVLGNSFISEIFGYACLHEGEVSVVSPLWVSPDNIEAHFVHFPQVGTRSALVRDWLLHLLQAREITYGAKQDEIDRLLHDFPDENETASFLVACGVPPQEGEHTRIEYTFDPEKNSCEHLPDGSVDFRSRNTFVAVKEGQLLAEISAPTPGKAGIDLTGKTISVSPGRPRRYQAGKNVGAKSEGGAPKSFYAEKEGNVKVHKDIVSVSPTIYIDGDVDYDLGDIEAGKDVHITGSVRSGFSIKAGGSVLIGGTVESGACLNAREDVIAAQGIVGETTRVMALGNVQTKYIQNSSVMARGSIIVGSYLLNADVHAGGKLVVHAGGGERGGSIVGGRTFSSTGVEARLVGSSTTDRTLVGIGPDPDIAVQLHKLGKGLDRCQHNILRLFRTLDIREIRASHFKDIIERMPQSKRRHTMALLEQLKELVERKKKGIKMQQDLEKRSSKNVEKAQVAVSGTAFNGVQIHMGGDSLTLDEDLLRPLFYKTVDGIKWNGE